jgi:hypothetical protein
VLADGDFEGLVAFFEAEHLMVTGL